MPASVSISAPDSALATSRRRLVADGFGIIFGASAFGFVFGLTARTVGFSPLEASAMSVIVFAGAAQFAALGYVAGGFSWIGIVLLTLFLNARHLLYATALAPYLTDRPRPQRAILAHLLTDEAFALSIGHFRRIRRGDVRGYVYAAFGTTFIPWNVATLAGVLVGGEIPDPSVLGIDVVFPAAMAGLAIGLMTGRREVVAAIVGAILAVGVSLAWDPAAGIIAGGLLGPLVALAARVPDTSGPIGAIIFRGGGAAGEPAKVGMDSPDEPPVLSVELVGLAVLMGLATYPSRAVPLLVPGMDRLPRPALAYLRLVGPAVLAALAAVEIMVQLDADRNASFQVGIEWLAVGLCVFLVARFHNLLAGMASAVILVALARATGLA